jgi:hypothetical protein
LTLCILLGYNRLCSQAMEFLIGWPAGLGGICYTIKVELLIRRLEMKRNM